MGLSDRAGFIPQVPRRGARAVPLAVIRPVADLPALPVDDRGVSGGGNRALTVGILPSKLLDAQSTRKYVMLQNVSDTDVYFGWGDVPPTAAEAISKGIKLAKTCGFHEFLRPPKNRLWAVADGAAAVDIQAMIGE